MEIFKTCTKCKESKRINHFNKQKTTKDGYKTECKQCAAARNKKIYEKKSKIARAIYIDNVMSWQKNNPEKVKDYLQKYRNK